MLELDACDARVHVSIHHVQASAREIRLGIGHLHERGFAGTEQVTPRAVAFFGSGERLACRLEREIGFTRGDQRLVDFDAQVVP